MALLLTSCRVREGLILYRVDATIIARGSWSLISIRCLLMILGQPLGYGPV